MELFYFYDVQKTTIQKICTCLKHKISFNFKKYTCYRSFGNNKLLCKTNKNNITKKTLQIKKFLKNALNRIA